MPLDKKLFLCEGINFPVRATISCALKFSNHNLCNLSKITEKKRKNFEKGIDFMGKLRYNWSVHEQNKKQEV